jgi:hypothetical protein
MNPISMTLFLVFMGIGALSFAARLPLIIPAGFALAGILIGWSLQMAQQWQRP